MSYNKPFLQQTSGAAGAAMSSLFEGISTFLKTNWPVFVAAAALPVILVKKQVLTPLYSLNVAFNSATVTNI